MVTINFRKLGREKIEEGGKWDLGGGKWEVGGREVGTVYPPVHPLNSICQKTVVDRPLNKGKVPGTFTRLTRSLVPPDFK